jgi:hypothetical protein
MEYTAIVSHRSIRRVRRITVAGSLFAAKRAATREFGHYHPDREIIVMDRRGHVVSRRRIGERRWLTGQPMRSRLLRETGRALYGSRWKTDLSRHLGVTDRTIRSWAGGKNMPLQVASDLLGLVFGRMSALDVLADRLRRAGGYLPPGRRPSSRGRGTKLT